MAHRASVDYRALAASRVVEEKNRLREDGGKQAKKALRSLQVPTILRPLKDRKEAAIDYINDKLSTKIESFDDLKDGRKLCDLVNQVFAERLTSITERKSNYNPDSPRFVLHGRSDSSLMSKQQRVHEFIHVCKILKVPRKHMCSVEEIKTASKKMADLILVLQEMEATKDREDSQEELTIKLELPPLKIDTESKPEKKKTRKSQTELEVKEPVVMKQEEEKELEEEQYVTEQKVEEESQNHDMNPEDSNDHSKIEGLKVDEGLHGIVEESPKKIEDTVEIETEKPKLEERLPVSRKESSKYDSLRISTKAQQSDSLRILEKDHKDSGTALDALLNMDCSKAGSSQDIKDLEVPEACTNRSSLCVNGPTPRAQAGSAILLPTPKRKMHRRRSSWSHTPRALPGGRQMTEHADDDMLLSGPRVEPISGVDIVEEIEDEDVKGKEILLRGTLEKRGGWNRAYKWRYFELIKYPTHGHLCYYQMLGRNNGRLVPLGYILLLPGRTEISGGMSRDSSGRYSSVNSKSEGKDKEKIKDLDTTFCIKTPRRTFELRAVNPEMANKWISAILSVLLPRMAKTLSGKAAKILGEPTTQVSKSGKFMKNFQRRVSSLFLLGKSGRQLLPEDTGAQKDTRRKYDLSAPVLRSAVIKEGFLDKKGKNRNAYRNRFFQLLSQYESLGLPCMVYSEPKQARTNNFIGVIPLVRESCVVIPDPVNPLLFSVVVPGRRYEFRARSENERNSWSEALRELLQQEGAALTKEDNKKLIVNRAMKSFSFSSVISSNTPRMKTTMEGFLEKRGGGVTSFGFRTRFFRLHVDTGMKPFGNLTYAADNKTWEILGSVDIIPGVTKVAIDGNDGSKRTFNICNPTRTYVLRAVATSDMRAWIHGFMDILAPKQTLQYYKK